MKTVNGFRKTCNPTVRKFYEDYDLLPREMKKLLWEQDSMPNLDDLKAAWELLEEDRTPAMDRIIQNLNCFEERRREEKENKREQEKTAKQKERLDRWNRRNRNRIEIMVRVDPRKRIDRHANLVRLVMTEKELEAKLTRRKNNDEVQHAAPYWVRKWVEPAEIKDKKLNFMENEPTDSLIKSLHNA